MKLNIYIIVLLAHFASLMQSCSQNKLRAKSENEEVKVLNPYSERDFKELDSVKSIFCDYPVECEHYEKLTYFDKRLFEDKVSKHRMDLALKFLEHYPDDPYYDEVLNFFFNLNFEPRFVIDKVPDSLTIFFSKNIQFGTPDYYKRIRSLPIDLKSRKEWLEKGYKLASEYLQSDASLEKKVKIEIAILARDFRNAVVLYNSLYKERKGVEENFWMQFDELYWKSFKLRMVGLVEKYSEMETMANYVEQLIGLVTRFSPHLAKSYWEDFLKLSETKNAMSNGKGVIALKKMAENNLDALKKIDDSKPLEMTITTIDGAKVDVEKLRGKVLVIDFWSISCAPCIKEMPHLQTMYDKYRDQGFEVIGLAGDGDESKNRVLEIIEKQGATWPQSLDKGKDAHLSYHSLYNIRSYPTVWLINKEGKIVDKNARGERLEPLIRKYLDLDK